MSALSTTTKARLGVKATKHAAKRPRLLLWGAQSAKPVVRGRAKVSSRQTKRQAQRHAGSVVQTAQKLGQTTFATGQTVIALGRQLALQQAEARAGHTRTGPRVAAGVVIGATAMYFLEPSSGAQHRQTLSGMVKSNDGASGEPQAA
jgi:hypothetical protein